MHISSYPCRQMGDAQITNIIAIAGYQTRCLIIKKPPLLDRRFFIGLYGTIQIYYLLKISNRLVFRNQCLHYRPAY